MSIQYTGAGTDAEVSIQVTASELKLTTTITGQSHNLDIVLEDASGNNQHTLQSLADLINADANYTCTATSPVPGRNANELDRYVDLEMREVAGVLRTDIFDTITGINIFSQLVTLAREATRNIANGMATVSPAEFLTGGTAGTSANSNLVDALTAMEDERINTIVPLISADSGSVTIDSVNASVKTHVIKMNGTLGKSERNAYVSKETAKATLKTAAQTLNNQYVSMLGQSVEVLDKSGTLGFLAPWSAGCICAGMQAGSPTGEPTTFKIVNINDQKITDGSWSAKADAVEMLKAGVTVIKPIDSGGFRIALGNTTWVTDGSFVFNRVSVVEASGFVAYDLRLNLEAAFTGTKARTGTADAIANFIRNRMSIYLSDDITVGDDLNDNLGFKNLRVTVTGNTSVVNISITPVQGNDFILPTIFLSDIKQTA